MYLYVGSGPNITGLISPLCYLDGQANVHVYDVYSFERKYQYKLFLLNVKIL